MAVAHIRVEDSEKVDQERVYRMYHGRCGTTLNPLVNPTRTLISNEPLCPIVATSTQCFVAISILPTSSTPRWTLYSHIPSSPQMMKHFLWIFLKVFPIGIEKSHFIYEIPLIKFSAARS